MNTPRPLYEVEVTPDYTLLRFSGNVDACCVEKLRPEILNTVPETAANIIVDLSKVEFLDSHGVGMLVSLLKRSHKNSGKTFFAGAAPQPLSVLKMVGFNSDIVTYAPNAQEALDLLRKNGQS